MFRESGLLVSLLVLAISFAILGSVPWTVDERRLPGEARIEKLAKSRFFLNRVEFRSLTESLDPKVTVDGRPVVLIAAMDSGEKEVLERVLFRGADVNSSGWGCTPLLYALIDSSNRSEFVPLLLKYGAQPNLFPNLPEDRPYACREPQDLSERELLSGRMSVLAYGFGELQYEVIKKLLAKRAGFKSPEEAEHYFKPALTLWLEAEKESGSVWRQVLYQELRHASQFLNAIFAASIERSDFTESLRLLRAGASPRLEGDNSAIPLVMRRGCASSIKFWREDGRRNWQRADGTASSKNAEVRLLIQELLRAGALRREERANGQWLIKEALKTCSSDIVNDLLDAGVTVAGLDIYGVLGEVPYELRDLIEERRRNP